jgi:DNA uptake protein ComE-like DNA-binding protein
VSRAQHGTPAGPAPGTRTGRGERRAPWRAGLAAIALAIVAGLSLAARAQEPEEPQGTTIPPQTPAPTPENETRGRLDLNRATLEEIRQLPVPPAVAQAIYDFRTYNRYFASIYDVAEVPGMTPELLEKVRPLVATMPPESKDETFQRWDAAFRQVQRFLSEEGSREEVADEYLDLLRDPRNLNRMNLFDLMSFQNVSPVDAVAILKGRERSGQVENERQLRSSDGLSYWGYRNLRDYVVYQDPLSKGQLRGDAQLLTFNTPYVGDDKDVLTEPLPGSAVNDFDNGTAWGIRNLDAANPAIGTKIRLRLGSQWRGGLMSFRQVGEQHLAETVKGFVSWRSLKTGPIGIDRAVLGHYRIALGQGLVMDNSDYFVARKTGYGYSVRPRSVYGDVSRSQEFALRGGSFEAHAGPFHGVAFYSRDKKDALINPDGSLNRMVVMKPRFENYELRDMTTLSGTPFGLRRDAFTETLYGGALQGQLWTGTYLGVEGYEARYDEPWNPDINTLVPAGSSGQGLLQARDRELYSAYDSRQLGKFRRVLGAEFQTVYQNVALQGEYAKLDTNQQNGIDGLLSAAPEAYTVNAYVQYENLNVQLLWRDYDVGFDNPYARPFSEDSRYEQTLLEDPFRLQNPLLSWLAYDTPQSKAERGLYANLRYQVTRNFTITGLEFDQWTRKADGQDQRRWVARLEYAPIFPLRFRLRQRFSSRGEMIGEDVRRFRGWDTRLEAIARLSGYDQLRFLYSTSMTQFASRPRLSGTADPGPSGSYDGSPLGMQASPAQALQAVLEHNVNDRLQFVFSSEIYDGFLYNYEDNEFIVLDDTGFRNWFLVRSRFSDSMMMRVKVTQDRPLTRTNVDIRQYGNEYGFWYEGDNVRRRNTSFRLQLDYTF